MDAQLTQWVLPSLQLEIQEMLQHLGSADLRLLLPGLSCTNVPSRVAPGLGPVHIAAPGFSLGMYFGICHGLGFGGKAAEALLRRANAGQELLPVLLPTEIREMDFGVFKRKKLRDQTFPWPSCNVGSLLAGGGEGVMSCPLLALGLQRSSGLAASSLLTKQTKKYHFCSFERWFPSPLHLPSPAWVPDRRPGLAFEALPMV